MGPPIIPVMNTMQQHCPAVVNQIDVSSSLIGSVNSAGHLACSLPRGATLAFHVVCSPATTIALASQPLFLSFRTLCALHFQYTHAHRVPYHSNDCHDQSNGSLLCSLLQRSPRSKITLIQTMIVTRSKVTLFHSRNQQTTIPIRAPQSSATMQQRSSRSNVTLLSSATINSLCRKDNRRIDDGNDNRRNDDATTNVATTHSHVAAPTTLAFKATLLHIYA
jgi:hypothetical protein